MTKLETILEYGDTAKLEIDKHGRMYWNGEAVLTSQAVKLSRFVSISIISAGVSALATVAIEIAQIYQWLPVPP